MQYRQATTTMSTVFFLQAEQLSLLHSSTMFSPNYVEFANFLQQPLVSTTRRSRLLAW